jgi:hypothetical protein
MQRKNSNDGFYRLGKDQAKKEIKNWYVACTALSNRPVHAPWRSCALSCGLE